MRYVILRNGVQYAGGSGRTLTLDANGVIWAETNQNTLTYYTVSGEPAWALAI